MNTVQEQESTNWVAAETARVRSLTLSSVGNIPPKVRALSWLCYRFVPRDNGKLGKPPTHPTTGRNVAHDDPKFYLTFDQAMRALQANRPGNLAGIGIRFTGEGGLVGIDLDNCLPPDGSPLPWAQEILSKIDTYTEISPSGKGLRLFGNGAIPEAGGKHGDCEAYQDKRFLTVTGNVFRGRSEVKTIPPDTITWFWKTFIRPDPEPAKPANPPRSDDQGTGAPPPRALPTTPAEVIALAERSKNGDKFRRLMAGDLSDHGGDHSAADLALCCVLAFYCGRDPALMDATFRVSGLMRPKWDEKRGETTYGQKTIGKAIERTTETYAPKPERSGQGKATGGGGDWREQPIPPAPEDPADWLPPVPFDRPTLPEIPRGSFPDWIEAMIDAAAAATETPRELGVGLALFALSTACQKVFSTRPEAGYFEQLSLYTLLVMDSSNRKTAVQKPFLLPIFHRQDELTREAAERIKGAERKIKNTDAMIDGLRRLLSQSVGGKAKRTREDIEAEIEELEQDKPGIPATPTLLVNDITSERLPVLMSENNERMGLFADEGGIFETMAGRYSKGVPNLDIFLQGYPGSYVRIDRGGRPPITLQHPALSLCVFSQTEVLSGLGDKPGFRGRGLLGRFLYLIPPSNLGYRRLQTTPIPDAVSNTYYRHISALLQKTPAMGEHGPHPHALLLSLGAFQEWKEFALGIEATMRPGGGLESMTDYAGKVPGHAARIAGLLHCAKHAEGDPQATAISQETMGRALGIMAALVEHAKYAYGLVGADPRLEDAKKVLNWIEKNNLTSFSARDAHNAMQSRFKTVETLNEALEILGERFYIGEVEQGKRPGRPTRVFRVNPKARGGEG